MIQSILAAVLPCQFWFGDISRIVVTHYVATSRFFEKPAFHIYDFHNDFPKDFLLAFATKCPKTYKWHNHQTYHFCELFWNSNFFLLWVCDNYIPGYIHDILTSFAWLRDSSNFLQTVFTTTSSFTLLSRPAPPSYGAPPPPPPPAPVYAGPSQDSYRL